MAQKILKINENECKWIEDNLQMMREVLRNILGEERDNRLTPAYLDRAYSAWISAHRWAALE